MEYGDLNEMPPISLNLNMYSPVCRILGRLGDVEQKISLDIGFDHYKNLMIFH